MLGELSAGFIYPNVTARTAAAMKVSVPVRPLYLPNMVFKHVIGVPARSDEESTPIYKLQLLDSLIDRLVRVSGSLAPRPEELRNGGESIDARIAAVGSRLRSAVESRQPFTAGILPAAGAFVNRLA